MASLARQKETLTPKGRRTRVRIVDAAAELIYERGVTATTLEDVKAAAEVSRTRRRWSRRSSIAKPTR
jgi:AcrR family transcriptional regulator